MHVPSARTLILLLCCIPCLNCSKAGAGNSNAKKGKAVTVADVFVQLNSSLISGQLTPCCVHSCCVRASTGPTQHIITAPIACSFLSLDFRLSLILSHCNLHMFLDEQNYHLLQSLVAERLTNSMALAHHHQLPAIFCPQPEAMYGLPGLALPRVPSAASFAGLHAAKCSVGGSRV